MTIQSGNIGKARLQVTMLPRSPFNGIPEQEWSYYLTKDNLGSMTVPSNDIDALPAPFNGYRIIESSANYDNYLMDTKKKYLEDFDSASSRRVQLIESIHGKPSGPQKKFFTWQVGQNLFFNSPAASTTGSPSETPTSQTVPNPGPTSFDDAQAQPNSNIPTWSYVQKTNPNSRVANIITPFMNKVMSDHTGPVHWGAEMISSLALNQGFEILFYHDGQVHAIADDAPKLDFIYGDQNLGFPDEIGSDGKPKPFDLSKRAYFAIEIGVTNNKHRYLLLFVKGKSPRSYVVGKKGAGFLNEFTDFDGEKLFDPDNTFFNCKVEPVGNGLLITSTQFDGKVWAITGTNSDPIFVGQGPLHLYSGNIQAGFAMRPLQYKASGEFTTPSNTIVQAGGDDRVPICTTAIKGVGDDATRASSGASSGGEVHAADAEKINGQAGKSFFDYLAGEPDLVGGIRTINCTIQQVPDPNTDPSAQDAAVGPNTTQITKKTYAINVKMKACDLPQPGSGFVVKNGRSPYIWQIRATLPQEDHSGSNDQGIDISCDVLSCDMSWNASSYNELNHTGTLKILNRPRVGEGIDYKGITNRAVYFSISAWWDGGLGHDPEGDGRKIFEGMSVGATVDTQAEKEVVTLKLEDYMNALHGGKFVLSPYYDGMKAVAAVHDIVRQIGLSEDRILTGDTQINQAPNDPQGFGLPFTGFDAPQFRFPDGSSYKEAVLKIAQLDGKTCYFDTQGRFHYDPVPGGITGSQNYTTQASFFSSPRQTDTMKHVCWNMTSFTRAINDVYNVIQVSTVDKITGDPIHVGDVNDAALHDPNAEGYLGYRKHLMIREAALGGYGPAASYLATYRDKIFIPPLTVRFEIYGYSGLKPLDVITVDGTPVRIMNISRHISAQENMYWMNIEGEWFFGGAGKWQSPTINNEVDPQGTGA